MKTLALTLTFAAAGLTASLAAADSPTFVHAPRYNHVRHIDPVADIIHAKGRYNRLTAEAAHINAHTNRVHLENHMRAVDIYYTKKEINEAYRKSHRRPRITQEQAEYLAEKSGPRYLSPEQLGLTRGEIHWPKVLQHPVFAAHRSQMERLLARHTGDARTSLAIEQTSEAMQAQLKDLIRQMKPSDYLAALKTIESLEHHSNAVSTFAPAADLASK